MVMHIDEGSLEKSVENILEYSKDAAQGELYKLSCAFYCFSHLAELADSGNMVHGGCDYGTCAGRPFVLFFFNDDRFYHFARLAASV
ncbi:hypothetical protein GCM10028868_15940 [Virgibacillus kimchii]